VGVSVCIGTPSSKAVTHKLMQQQQQRRQQQQQQKISCAVWSMLHMSKQRGLVDCDSSTSSLNHMDCWGQTVTVGLIWK